MSSLEDRLEALEEQSAFDAKHATALASVQRSQRLKEGEGLAVMHAAMSFGEDALEGPLARVVHGAKLFCIAALFIIPNALVIYLS